MPKILIDILPARGHFHATLKIASILKNAGYDVVYGSDFYLQSEVEKFGFQFFYLSEVSVAKVSFAIRFSKFYKLATFFFWLVSREKYLMSKKAVIDFQATAREIEPDLVLLDEQSALKTVFYNAINVKVIAFQTKPDTRKIKGLPPFTSYYLPKGRISNLYCSLLWLAKLSNYRFNYFYNRIFSFAQDNFSILKKIGRDFNIDLDKKVDIKRSFGVGIRGINRLVISPAAFDFPHPEKVGVFRVGPLVDIQREGKIDKLRYGNLLAQLESGKENLKEFTVYCSLGTITRKFKKEVKKFFKKMAKVALLNPNYLFVISTGADFDVEVLYPTPNNLFIFDYVPQIKLLQYCDVMITHGGMNSITECIYNNVPMLVYPLSPQWDQPGNSARVVYHGLGLRGKIGKDAVKTISKKINLLKSNYSYYQKNVLVMKEKFEENNNSDEILEIIRDILKKSKVK